MPAQPWRLVIMVSSADGCDIQQLSQWMQHEFKSSLSHCPTIAQRQATAPNKQSLAEEVA